MYHFHTLPNGLKILMVPIPGFKSVTAAIFVKVGSRYENLSLSGAAHFIEHMLFKGTSQRPSSKLIAEAIEGIGGVGNAYTDQETTVYYAKVAAAHAETAIDILTDLVRNSLFTPQEIEKERLVIAEELNMVYDSPDSWVTVLTDALLWPNHPLGQNVAGTPQSLANVTPEELVSFYQAAYHPHNLLVTLAGALEPDKIVTAFETRLGDWQPRSRPQFEPAPDSQIEPRWQVENRPLEQGHLSLGLPALPRTDPDRYALSLLNAILGEGMSSRLFLSIREEKGLAYSVDSGLSLLQDTGSLVIYAGVPPRRASEALAAILAELARLRTDPVPEEELRKSKEYLKGRLALGLEDSFNQAAWVAYQTLFMDQVKTPEEVLQAYEAVTAADIQAVAQRIIQPARYNLAAVGPFEQGEALVELVTG
jgi:predicted Zn-dependent peptidase